MDTTTYKPKIDWWVYLVLVIMMGGCIFGLLSEGELAGGLILGIGMLALWLFAITGVRYEIRGNQLGIRNFYRWTWIPVNNIATAEKIHGIYVHGSVSASLSLDLVRLTLNDRNILRSTMPINISPKDRSGFMTHLKEVNPDVEIK